MTMNKNDFDYVDKDTYALILKVSTKERDEMLKSQEKAEKLDMVDSLFAELEIPLPYDLWLAESVKIRENLKKRIEFCEKWIREHRWKSTGYYKSELEELQKIYKGEEK